MQHLLTHALAVSALSAHAAANVSPPGSSASPPMPTTTIPTASLLELHRFLHSLATSAYIILSTLQNP